MRLVEFDLLGTKVLYEDIMIIAAHKILRDKFPNDFNIFIDSNETNCCRYFVRVVRPDGVRFRIDCGILKLGLPEDHTKFLGVIDKFIEMIKEP